MTMLYGGYTMRRLAFFILALLVLSLTIPQLLAQQEPPPQTNSILQWVDSEPLTGQELGLDSVIQLFFDRPLDCATVEAAFSIQPDIDGSLHCEGTSLRFDPSQAFERANTYVVTLDADLRGIDGAALYESLVIEFNTVGFVQISETFPSPDTSSIELDSAITIIFNRPIVPLVIREEMDNLPNPISINPPVEGQGEWLNTSIFVFEPNELLAAGVEYEVTVNAGLSSSDGAVLPEDYVFHFSTQAPSIIDFFPTDGQTAVGLEDAIQVRFNLEMERTSTEAAFFLIDENGNRVAGSFEWSDDGQGFRYIPNENLALETSYEAGFEVENISSVNGGIGGLEGVHKWSFTTVPYPAVTFSSPDDGEELVRPYGGFVIYFASPMDEESVEERITIEPTPEFEPRFYYRDWSDSVEVAFQPYPSTTYTVTLAPGAEDLYGNTINEEYSFSYTTDAFAPEVSLRVPENIGFYNAQRDPTSVFVTYRNIDSFDVSLYDVPLEQFGNFVMDGNRYYYDLAYEFNPAPNSRITSWTIDGSVVPENALRFDLLSFDRSSGQTSCASSMPSRLQVGDDAIVLADPDPIRARSEPSVGEIVDLLYKDYALPIIGGPVCGDDGLLWWQVRLRDGTEAWVAESIEQEYLVGPRDDTNVSSVPVSNAEGGALNPGIYFLRIDSEEFRNQGHLMVVADANLVVKHTIDSVMIWATDAQTGLPIPNAPITVYGANYTAIAAGTTDADGILFLAVPPVSDLYQRRMAVLDTAEHFGIGYSEWSEGIHPYQFGQSYDYYPTEYRIYVYTDRPVYRPNQPVYVRGIVRRQDDMDYFSPDADETVHVSLYNSFGDTVLEEDLPLSEYGTFDWQVDLDPDTVLGYYSVYASMPGRSEYDYPQGGVRFNVAEYRLPEFLVDVIPEAPAVVQGDTIRVTIDSSYFFGGSVSDAVVEYSVIGENFFFRYEGAGYYDFSDYNYDAGPSEFYATSTQGAIATGSATTDAQGEFTIEIPAELGDASQSQNYIIEALVRDESGQTVAGRATVTVHQGELYIGARPERYVSVVGQESLINIVAVDWDSEPVANQRIDVEVLERRWSSVQERDEYGNTIWTWEVEEIPVTTGQVQSDADGEAVYRFSPPRGGSYKVLITTRDSRGNEIRSSTFVWVSSREYVSWRQQNSNRIELIADRPDYSVGDTAQILITSPFQGMAEALVTVERGDVLFVERVTMDSNSLLYELPITEDFAPNAYVSVMIIKGVDETNPVAAFRMGYVQIGVDPERRELNIEISSNVDRSSPQQTVTYTVRTTDWAGNPVSAEVGVGVTDLAALSLAPMNSGPLFNYFFSEQSLMVRTSTPLTVNTDQITQEVLDTVKGGGGGIMTDGLIEIRGEFIDTPFWNAHLVTDANGYAIFDVRLPDNLTTWRLDARALTLAEDGNMLVGQNTFDLLSTKPLIIRPVTPRFFIVGDEVYLAAVVNNNTTSAQDVVVTINAEGVTLHNERAQIVTIQPDSRARVTWRATVEDVQSSRFSFTADAGNFSDGSISPVALDDEGTIPVYRYEAPETVGTAGTLETVDSRVETIYLPERFEVTQGTLTVQVDQSLAATTLDGLEYLKNYPYQCTEQTVSRFLPNILSYRALESFDLADAQLEIGLESNVNFGLQKLLAEQHFDGGWGWWVESSSNPVVTAYVLIGLTEARNQGFEVPDRVIESGQEYLRNNFIRPNTNTEYWQANRQAFVLYALAYSGAPDVGRTAALYEYRSNLSTYGLALLAQTFYFIDRIDTTRTDVLLSDILNNAITSAAGIHWEETSYDYWNWNTNTRTTAIVLSTLVKLRPTSDLIPNVVRYLMIQRRADAWETTQETAWSVMALTDWMLASGELEPDYSYDVSFNGTTELSGTASADTVRDRNVLFIDVSEMLRGQANSLVFTRTGTNEGNLYYTAYLTAYLSVPDIEPVSNGITISRIYTLQGDETETPVTEAHVGDVLNVRLTFVIPNGLHYVMISDPLPAGGEGINPNLSTSQQIGTRPSLDSQNPYRYGWGWWWFSKVEFRDEAVNIFADYLPAGTYEYVYTMRAGIEGSYNVIPPTAQEFYFPDIYGRGAGSLFTILPAQ
jgi:alpha-2-macroglobulin